MVVQRFDPAPAPSDAMPLATSIMQADPGSSQQVARADHKHPVRLQRKRVVSDANGQVTWNFSTPFSSVPAIAYMVENLADQPMVANIIECDEDHVKVQLFQSQKLPSTLVLLSGLVSFNIFGQAPATLAGKTVHLFAAEPTA